MEAWSLRPKEGVDDANINTMPSDRLLFCFEIRSHCVTLAGWTLLCRLGSLPPGIKCQHSQGTFDSLTSHKRYAYFLNLMGKLESKTLTVLPSRIKKHRSLLVSFVCILKNLHTVNNYDNTFLYIWHNVYLQIGAIPQSFTWDFHLFTLLSFFQEHLSKLLNFLLRHDPGWGFISVNVDLPSPHETLSSSTSTINQSISK